MTSTLPAAISNLEDVLSDFLDIYQRVVDGQVGFLRIVDLIADEGHTDTLSVGSVVRIAEHDGFDLVVVAGGLVDYQSASGKMFRVSGDRVSPMYFGGTGDGETDDTTALDRANASEAIDIDLQGRDYVYVGAYEPTKPIANGRVIDDAGTRDFRAFTEDRIATVAEAALGEPGDKVPTLDGLASLVAAQLATQPLRNVVQTAYLQSKLYPAATDTELDELRAIIETQFDGSRVEVKFAASIECSNNNVLRIFRNGVEIMRNQDVAPGVRPQGVFPIPRDDNTSSTMSLISFSVIDTVQDAGVYEYRFHITGTNGAVSLNRTISDTNSSVYERLSSVVVLEEIRT